MTARAVVVVDGANVVGARPDGWWRDRAGAAARLHSGLVAVDAEPVLGARCVVLVLEGRARPGVPEGVAGRVRTVHAAGEGDDEIVARAAVAREGGDPVTVVTADRGLAARARSLGADVVGPSWLLDRIGRDARGEVGPGRPPGSR